jgi:uncharacterized membrane protein
MSGGRRLVQVTAALALAGAGIAGYLTYVHYTGTRVACPTGGCETVQSSSYALLGPLPVALLGLLAYIAILAGLLLPNAVRWTVVLATSLSGAIFSAYLFAVQALELHAFCTWCLVSDVLITALAALSATALFTDEPRRQRSSRKGLAS